MSNRKIVLIAIIIALIGLLSSAGYAEECDHQWIRYDEHTHGVLPEEVRFVRADDMNHVYIWRKPKQVCELCGEREQSEYGTGAHVAHSYTVTQWSMNEVGDTVYITLACGVCQYVYDAEVPLQTILDGTADICLFGGECTSNAVGYQYENGLIMSLIGAHSYPADFEVGEKIWYSALVYVADRDQFLFTSREFCPVCCRPRSSGYYEPQVRFNPNWNGIPIMDEEYFLTDGVPENLPYQLIDQLREEAAAAQ